jgi:hypothetical protein
VDHAKESENPLASGESRRKKMSSSPNAAVAASGILKVPRIHIVDSTVANAGSTDVILQVQADADFEWWWLSISRTSALLKALIAEAGSGNRQFVYSGNPQAQAFQGILVDNLAGLVANNGALPIAVPYVMPAGRTYTHHFTDQTSGAPNVVQFAYHGFALLRVAS